jgi:hypothetical protein
MKINLYSCPRLFIVTSASMLGLLVDVRLNNATFAKDLATVREAISERERLPDPFQLTVSRISEISGEKWKPESKYVIKWRPDAKISIQTDDEDRVVVVASNDKYSFKTTISLVGTPFMLNDFIVGEGREAMIEPWDVQRKLLRSDLFLLGTISLRELVDNPTAVVEQDTNGSIQVTVKPTPPSAGEPSLVECVLDPSKNYLVTSAHVVDAENQDIRWEAVEVAEIAPNYFMSKVERTTTVKPASNQTTVSTDRKVYSMEMPSMDEFRMTAYGILEPEDEVPPTTIPYFYIFIGSVVVVVFLISLLRFYIFKPTQEP